MANYNTLKSDIADNIKQNGTNAITGQILQSALMSIINSLGAGYQFIDVATPTTNPGTPDQRVFYIASVPGSYPNFSNITVDENEIVALVYDESWSKSTIASLNFASNSDIDTLRYNISLDELPILVGYSGKYATISGLLKADGTVQANSSYKTSDFLEIPTGSTKIMWQVLFPNLGGNSGLNLYDSDKNFIAAVNTSTYTSSDGNIGNLDLSNYPNAKFLRFCPFNLDDSHLKRTFVVCGNDGYDINTLLNGVNVASFSAPTSAAWLYKDGLNNQGKILINFHSPGNNINFGIRDFTAGKWLVKNRLWNEQWAFVNIPDGHSIWVYALSEENTDVPVTVQILPYSGVESCIIGIAEKADELPNVVNIGPGKEYTTLRSGIAAAYQEKNTKVYVYPGTYNLINEFSEEIAAHTGGTVGNLVGNGMHIIFLPGAYVKANYIPSGNSEQDDWVSVYFNPFYTDASDFTIENLDIEAANTRYCIHDELAGLANSLYIHKFINCRMKMSYNYAASHNYMQCIGGGIGQNAYIEIDGGYYESNIYSGVDPNAISYHNGANVNADSVIYIRNLYVAGNGYIRYGAYGPSQTPTRMYVSGCSMGKAIVNAQEQSGGTSVLANLTEWNNTIRS